MDERFANALNFVAVQLRRLEADSNAVDPIHWHIKNWESLLWALQQQAQIGPCDAGRARKDYSRVIHNSSIRFRSCYSICGDSKVKKWEMLGAMKKSHATAKYIELIDRILPGWDNPYTADVSLLVDWTPDSFSTSCCRCNEGFTFLNRRHHCRRCFQLVCAPCSPDRIGIRLSPGAPVRIQRICKTCVCQMDGAAKATDRAQLPPSGQDARTKNSPHEAEITPILDPDSLIKRGSIERLTGAAYRKVWKLSYIVVLMRKGTVGIYENEIASTPSEVFQLAGCTIRLKSEKKRLHQFKLLGLDDQTILRLSSSNIKDMNEWITAFASAIRAANEGDVSRTQMCLHYENQMIARNRKQRELPVTIVTGFLGSGKTTLMKHILRNRLNLRIACAVNDFASINMDERLISDRNIDEPSDEVIRMKSGAVCCPVLLDESYSDLKQIVWKILHDELVPRKEFDYLIIETSGTSDPVSLISAVQEKFGKMTRARLDSVVTVVDVDAWHARMEQGPTSTMKNQLKYADVVLLNKVDLVKDATKSLVLDDIKRFINPHTQTYECKFGKVALQRLLDIQPSNTADANTVITHEQLQPRWTASFGGNLHAWAREKCILESDTDDPVENFSYFVYESHDPLSLGGLGDWICSAHGVLRIKGVVYLQENPSSRYILQSSGRGRVEVVNSGPWQSQPGTQICVIGIDMDSGGLKVTLGCCRATQRLFEVKNMQDNLWFNVLAVEHDAVVFTLHFPKEKAARGHFHLLNIDQMNQNLIQQVNAIGTSTLLASVDSKDISGAEDRSISTAIVMPLTQNWDIVRERGELICVEIQKKINEFENEQSARESLQSIAIRQIFYREGGVLWLAYSYTQDSIMYTFQLNLELSDTALDRDNFGRFRNLVVDFLPYFDFLLAQVGESEFFTNEKADVSIKPTKHGLAFMRHGVIVGAVSFDFEQSAIRIYESESLIREYHTRFSLATILDSVLHLCGKEITVGHRVVGLESIVDEFCNMQWPVATASVAACASKVVEFVSGETVELLQKKFYDCGRQALRIVCLISESFPFFLGQSRTLPGAGLKDFDEQSLVLLNQYGSKIVENLARIDSSRVFECFQHHIIEFGVSHEILGELRNIINGLNRDQKIFLRQVYDRLVRTIETTSRIESISKLYTEDKDIDSIETGKATPWYKRLLPRSARGSRSKYLVSNNEETDQTIVMEASPEIQNVYTPRFGRQFSTDESRDVDSMRYLRSISALNEIAIMCGKNYVLAHAVPLMKNFVSESQQGYPPDSIPATTVAHTCGECNSSKARTDLLKIAIELQNILVSCTLPTKPIVEFRFETVYLQLVQLYQSSQGLCATSELGVAIHDFLSLAGMIEEKFYREAVTPREVAHRLCRNIEEEPQIEIVADILERMVVSPQTFRRISEIYTPAIMQVVRRLSKDREPFQGKMFQSCLKCFAALTRQPMDRTEGHGLITSMLLKGEISNMSRRYTKVLFSEKESLESGSVQEQLSLLEFYRGCISLFFRFVDTPDEKNSFCDRFIPSAHVLVNSDDGAFLVLLRRPNTSLQLQDIAFGLLQDIYSLQISKFTMHSDMVRFHFESLVQAYACTNTYSLMQNLLSLKVLSLCSESRKSFLYSGVLCFVTQELLGGELNPTIVKGDSNQSETGEPSSLAIEMSPIEPIPKLNLFGSTKLQDSSSNTLETMETASTDSFCSDLSIEHMPLQPDVPKFNLSLTQKHIRAPPGKSTIPVSVLKFRHDSSSNSMSSRHETSRRTSKLCSNDDLHCLALELILSLLVSPDQSRLESWYSGQYPETSSTLHKNILHVLHEHMNCGDMRQDFIFKLHHRVSNSLGQGPARLLRLISTCLFDASVYRDLVSVARGAFGTVYKCTSPIPSHENEYIAVKLLDRPQRSDQRCALHDVFSEVSILEKLRGSQCTAQLYSYGVTDDCYYVVMEYAVRNLKEWRLDHEEVNILDVLIKFREVCSCVAELHRSGIVHCDIKCDNIMVRSNHSNSVFVVDFGESIFGNSSVMRSRGTEGIKSPEMLLMGNGITDSFLNHNEESIERSKCSDVWSLGCLLFEICTGEPLFQTDNWSEFFTHLTKSDEPILSIVDLSKISQSLQDTPGSISARISCITELLNFMLERDQEKRPKLDAVLQKVTGIVSAMGLSPQRLSNDIKKGECSTEENFHYIFPASTRRVIEPCDDSLQYQCFNSQFHIGVSNITRKTLLQIARNGYKHVIVLKTEPTQATESESLEIDHSHSFVPIVSWIVKYKQMEKLPCTLLQHLQTIFTTLRSLNVGKVLLVGSTQAEISTVVPALMIYFIRMYSISAFEACELARTRIDMFFDGSQLGLQLVCNWAARHWACLQSPSIMCLCQQISISHAAGDVDDLGTECHCQNPQLPLACSDIYARQSRNLGSRMDVGELYGNCTKWMVVSSESIELNYHRIQMDDAQETSHLLKTEIIGQWKVHSCITCCCITHATNESSTAVITNLVNAKRKKQFYQLA